MFSLELIVDLDLLFFNHSFSKITLGKFSTVQKQQNKIAVFSYDFVVRFPLPVNLLVRLHYIRCLP